MGYTSHPSPLQNEGGHPVVLTVQHHASPDQCHSPIPVWKQLHKDPTDCLHEPSWRHRHGPRNDWRGLHEPQHTGTIPNQSDLNDPDLGSHNPMWLDFVQMNPEMLLSSQICGQGSWIPQGQTDNDSDPTEGKLQELQRINKITFRRKINDQPQPDDTRTRTCSPGPTPKIYSKRQQGWICW